MTHCDPGMPGEPQRTHSEPRARAIRARSVRGPIMVPGELIIAATLTPDMIAGYVYAQLLIEEDVEPVTAREIAERSGWTVEHAREVVRQLNEIGPPTTAQRPQFWPGYHDAFDPDSAVAAEPIARVVHEPNADGGSWEGPWPLVDGSAIPRKRQSVVYFLYGADDELVYLGSTETFRSRMKAHVKAGKVWTSWKAFPCEDRAAAYQLESELLAEHMPHLNVQGPQNRRGGAL